MLQSLACTYFHYMAGPLYMLQERVNFGRYLGSTCRKPPKSMAKENQKFELSTTLMAESEEELKNLLMKVKEESEKVSVKLNIWGAVLRWWRNRTGRPLSPSQIHQKNIAKLSKLHKTTSECWQRTSGTQKSRSLSSKTGRKKYKNEKRDKGGGEGAPSREGNPGSGRES